MKSPQKIKFDFVREKIETTLQEEERSNHLADELRRVQKENRGTISENALNRQMDAVCESICSVPDVLTQAEATPTKGAQRKRILSVLRASLVYWQKLNDLLPDPLLPSGIEWHQAIQPRPMADGLRSLVAT